MGQALYRKYRSKSFDDVVGQEHITSTLKKAIKNGRVAHAYLFTGPRGVGKTSVARILAHSVNDLDYTDESVHLDIIEIDAASNRRIDEIRELRDKVHTVPTSAKYKVYIIDEVHMLTREAFNALLKTLEEPPAHCIFILATTEAHKLPETIVSRTQRFEFKPIGKTQVARHLADIAKQEKLTVEEPALELIAEHGQGSFRDSIGLLDQLSAQDGKITEVDVREFLGLPALTAITAMVDAISSGDSPKVLESLDQLREQGGDPATTARLLAAELRLRLINDGQQNWIPLILRQLIEVPASARPDDMLEIAALEASSAVPRPEYPEHRQEPAAAEEVVAKPQSRPEPVVPPSEPESRNAGTSKLKSLDEKSWEEIVEKVKAQAASLYTALRLATPKVSEGKLILAFQFPLHQKKVNTAQNKAVIGQVVANVTGQNLTINTVLERNDRLDAKPKPLAIKPEASLQTISNIFGQPEVLES